MLELRTLGGSEGVTVGEAICRHACGRGEAEHYTGSHALVFVRRGCFVRHVDGTRALLDPTSAFCVNPGEEQRYDHPQAGGDDCTIVELDDAVLGQLPGVADGLPRGSIAASSRTGLAHRGLLAAVRRLSDRHELAERALTLVGATLARTDGSATAIRPSHASLTNQALEALAGDPNLSLSALARHLHVSPFHLSRTFRRVTGTTLAGHRNHLRVARAMERLGGGERDLARLAADLGFGDQSYLCRVIRAETGRTPAALRDALGPS